MGLNGYICNILANFACSFVLRQLFPTKATCIKNIINIFQYFTNMFKGIFGLAFCSVPGCSLFWPL